MSEAIRYCLTKEEHHGENVFNICRPNIMGNPFTHLSKTKAKNTIKVKSRSEAIKLYAIYFDSMIKSDEEFQKEWKRMFNAYVKFDKIYLGCFCENDEECHGDIIIKKLRQKAVKQMLANLKIHKANINV